ncbi:winged helix-turn-helix transcriptional regulator [Candidatus Woesearchaeota archaeon]|nr:winged helix-turn-helix transcriptional regulator [Candidatus Woesearchaeota archaeon]
MLKTNVDKILELLHQKPVIPVSEIAKRIGTTPDNVISSANNMQDEGLLKIEYKFMKPYLVLKEQKEGKKQPAEKTGETEVIKIDKDLLETEINEKKEPSEEKQYSSLDQEEVSETPAEMTISESNREREQDQQGFVDLNTLEKPGEKGIELEYTDSDEDMHEKQPENTQEIEQRQQETFAEDSSDFNEVPEPESFKRSDLSLGEIEKIDSLIDEANKKLDAGDNESINDLYAEIYHSFNELISLSPNERELLRDKITKLFNRIKSVYV